MAFGALLHPWRIITHVVSFGTLELLIGFGMPLLFLPYVAPRRLALAVMPFLIIALGAPGASALILQTHYGLFFLPAVMLAGVDGAVRALQTADSGKRPRATHAFGLATIGVLYAMTVLGPVPSGIMAIARGVPPEARAAETAVRLIPDDTAVAAGYRFLPRLASREHLYSLHYLYLGVTQFAELPYVADPAPDVLLMDEDDLLIYDAQFSDTAWARPYAADGGRNLLALGGQRTTRIGPYVVVDAGEGVEDTGGSGSPEVIGGSLEATRDAAPSIATLRLRVKGSSAMMSRLAVRAVVADATGEVLGERTFVLGGPFTTYPAPAIGGAIREANVYLSRPPTGKYRAEIDVVERDAMLVLDRLGTTMLDVRDERIVQSLVIEGTADPS
jgi:hypothetical protein